MVRTGFKRAGDVQAFNVFGVYPFGIIQFAVGNYLTKGAIFENTFAILANLPKGQAFVVGAATRVYLNWL